MTGTRVNRERLAFDTLEQSDFVSREGLENSSLKSSLLDLKDAWTVDEFTVPNSLEIDQIEDFILAEAVVEMLRLDQARKQLAELCPLLPTCDSGGYHG